MSAELAPAAPALSRSPILSDRQGFDRRWYAPNLQIVYTPTDTVGVMQAMKQAIQFGFQPGQIQITCAAIAMKTSSTTPIPAASST